MSTVDEPTGHAQAPVQPTRALQQDAASPNPYGQTPYGQVQPYGAHVPTGYAQSMAPTMTGRPLGPVGKVRSTWAVLGLTIVTFGIYSLYYHFVTHEEMKQHSGEGVGGALGLIISIFTLGLVTPFLLPNEVGNLYARQQRPRPVTATTGL